MPRLIYCAFVKNKALSNTKNKHACGEVNPIYLTFLFSVVADYYMHIDTNKQLIRTIYAVNKLFIEPHFMQSEWSVYYRHDILP